MSLDYFIGEKTFGFEAENELFFDPEQELDELLYCWANGREIKKILTEKEKEEVDRTSVLEKKVEHLEKEIKTLKKELLEMKKKDKEDTSSGTGKADLSFPAFRQFCLKYAEARAYFSIVN